MASLSIEVLDSRIFYAFQISLQANAFQLTFTPCHANRERRIAYSAICHSKGRRAFSNLSQGSLLRSSDTHLIRSEAHMFLLGLAMLGDYRHSTVDRV